MPCCSCQILMLILNAIWQTFPIWSWSCMQKNSCSNTLQIRQSSEIDFPWKWQKKSQHETLITTCCAFIIWCTSKLNRIGCGLIVSAENYFDCEKWMLIVKMVIWYKEVEKSNGFVSSEKESCFRAGRSKIKKT